MKRLLAAVLSVVLTVGLCINTPAATEKIPLSRLIQVIAWEFETTYEVAAPLLMSLVYEESKGNPKARSGNCKGLTQLNPIYFKKAIKELGVNDVYDEYQNMQICAYQLSKWFKEYGDADVYLIIEMWNEGEQNAIRTHNVNKPSRYAKNIVERAEEWTDYYYEDLNSIRPMY